MSMYPEAVQKDWPSKKRSRSPLHSSDSPSLRGGPNKRKSDAITMFPPQRAYATMPWAPPTSNSTNLVSDHEGVWMQCFPMLYPPYSQREGSRTPVHDQLGPHQSGQMHPTILVRPVPVWSDRSHWIPAQFHPPKQE